eukprot:GHVS01102454.1.p1 GENE.GHVS01102454.1~~GHVS01102454.1.p1  ORF type:complete len:208 (+),score=31.55 GHVS01102454.1:333-956(+)
MTEEQQPHPTNIDSSLKTLSAAAAVTHKHTRRLLLPREEEIDDDTRNLLKYIYNKIREDPCQITNITTPHGNDDDDDVIPSYNKTCYPIDDDDDDSRPKRPYSNNIQRSHSTNSLFQADDKTPSAASHQNEGRLKTMSSSHPLQLRPHIASTHIYINLDMRANAYLCIRIICVYIYIYVAHVMHISMYPSSSYTSPLSSLSSLSSLS